MRARELLCIGAQLAYLAGCAEPARTKPHSVPAVSASASGLPDAKEPGTGPLEPASLSVTRGYLQDVRYEYRVELDTKVALAQAAPLFDFSLRGSATVIPTLVSERNVTYYLALSDATIASRLPQTQAKFDQLARILSSTGCFVEVEAGRVSALRIVPGLPGVIVNAFRSVAAALQFSNGPSGVSHYEATEYDSTGQYQAAYHFDDTKQAWQRTKRKYLHVLGDPRPTVKIDLRVVPDITSGEGTLELDPSGRPLHVRSEDRLKIESGTGALQSSVTLRLDAIGTPRSAGASSWRTLFARTQPLPADQPYMEAQSEAALDDARTQGLSLDEILTRLRAPDTASTPAESGRLFVALAASLRKDPRAIPRVVEVIRANPAIAEVLLDALGSASSPTAQGALVAFIEHPNTPAEQRDRAVASLVRAAKPSPEAIEALKKLLRTEPSNAAALYGLGTYCRRLREAGQPVASRELGEFLNARLDPKLSSFTLTVLLRALTNAGYRGALPRLRPLLADARDDVRASAVRALQSIAGEDVDRLLAERLGADPDRDVRLSALQALSVREPSDSAARALIALGDDSEPHVRFRAVELMGQWSKVRPDLRQALERLASSDAEAKVRERARAAL